VNRLEIEADSGGVRIVGLVPLVLKFLEDDGLMTPSGGEAACDF